LFRERFGFFCMFGYLTFIAEITFVLEC
jgi:hypothetical protein